MVEEGRIEPQLAMKVVNSFDKAVTEVLADKVKARLNFKVAAYCDRAVAAAIADLRPGKGSSRYLSFL